MRALGGGAEPFAGEFGRHADVDDGGVRMMGVDRVDQAADGAGAGRDVDAASG